MGRAVKEKAFEEKGEAKRLASNADVQKFQNRILELRDYRRKQNSEIGAEIRDAYEDAGNAGVDVDTLKRNIKLIELGFTEDQKIDSNVYFEKTGQSAFFFTEGEKKAG